MRTNMCGRVCECVDVCDSTCEHVSGCVYVYVGVCMCESGFLHECVKVNVYVC